MSFGVVASSPAHPQGLCQALHPFECSHPCLQAAMERDLQLQEAQLLAAQDKAADAAFGKMVQVQAQQVRVPGK